MSAVPHEIISFFKFRMKLALAFAQVQFFHAWSTSIVVETCPVAASAHYTSATVSPKHGTVKNH